MVRRRGAKEISRSELIMVTSVPISSAPLPRRKVMRASPLPFFRRVPEPLRSLAASGVL
jgi:hypothetical protein